MIILLWPSNDQTPVQNPTYELSDAVLPVHEMPVDGHAAGGGAGGYDRQISRVRSLSVFSSESHCIQQEQDLHSDTDTPDSLSLDFNILDHNNQDSDEVL